MPKNCQISQTRFSSKKRDCHRLSDQNQNPRRINFCEIEKRFLDDHFCNRRAKNGSGTFLMHFLEMIHRITKILLNQKETGNFIIFEWCIIIKNATHPLTHKHTLDASDGSNLFRVKLCFILKHKLITSSIVPEHQVSTVGRCNVKYHFKLLFNASNDDDRWH